MDKFIAAVSLAMVVVMFGLVGAIAFGAPVATPGGRYTADDAMTAARQFVTAENTYKFDGIAETLSIKMNRTVSDGVFEVIVEFTSRQSGFGDRTGQYLLQVLTPHRAVIIVENGRIASAVMDGRWDMIAQEMIDARTRPSTMPALD